MCKTGPEAIFEMEHMGLPFSRTENGRIYQRPLVGNQRTLALVVKLHEPVLLLTAPAMRFYIPSIKAI